MAEKEPLFRCPNDLKVNVVKSNGEIVFDEECCTMVSVVLKNSGELATSFLGAHNPEIVKVLRKATAMYFKSIKKKLKESYKKDEDDIKVIDAELPKESKWSGEPVPDIKEKSTANDTKKENKDNKSNAVKSSANSSKKKPSGDSVTAKKATPANKIASKQSNNK